MQVEEATAAGVNDGNFWPKTRQMPEGETKVQVNWKIAVGVVLLLSLAVFAWATRFVYGTMHYGQQTLDVRTNRFTGETEKLAMAGWRAMTPSEPTLPVDHMQRDLELEKCVVTTQTQEEFVKCVDKVLP